ncbi:type VII secretion protein [Streptomyces sp. NPDC048361]|uniref:type VII secretion protein n=1 Tax=Streptomyces sp. NPDC048361 TaxID=3154720 RepID=UPI0034365E36
MPHAPQAPHVPQAPLPQTSPDPRRSGALDAIAAARAAAAGYAAGSPAGPPAAQNGPGTPGTPGANSAAGYGPGTHDANPAPHPGPAPGTPESRPSTLPELRVPRGRDAAVPRATPESVPTVDPRLAVALGKAVHGDSVTKRAGRSVRRLGSSASQDVAEETRIGRELQQPVTTGRVIAVTSIRGGVGKTTVAALLARSFNHYRHDPVLALEADGALGTLPVRLGAESVRWSCADLAGILTPAMQLTDVTGYLVPITDGGWLLPASQGRLGAPLSMRTYRAVTLALRRYFAVTVVDCETLPGEVARTAMDTAHARVVVAPMTAEGVGGTRVVLDWLAHLPHQALATTVVALTANSPDMTLDLKTATAHLREAGVTVFPVPYDRHLAQGGPIQTALLGQATRQAAVALAAEAMERAVRTR